MPSPWRFQGKLLESTSGSRDLYDFVARSYAPDLGAFTQLDSVAGSAQNPLTLNRYLYAAADPTTLIDPSGHNYYDPGCDCVVPGPATSPPPSGGPKNAGNYTTPAASVRKATLEAATVRAIHGSAAYDCARYGECHTPDATVLGMAIPSHDNGWDTISQAQQSQIDDPLLAQMVQDQKDADLSGPTGPAPLVRCGRSVCRAGSYSTDATPLLVLGGAGLVVLGGIACVAGVCEALGVGAAVAGATDAAVTAAGAVGEVLAGSTVARFAVGAGSSFAVDLLAQGANHGTVDPYELATDTIAGGLTGVAVAPGLSTVAKATIAAEGTASAGFANLLGHLDGMPANLTGVIGGSVGTAAAGFGQAAPDISRSALGYSFPGEVAGKAVEFLAKLIFK